MKLNLRPYTPPWALMYWSTELMAGPISPYPGAAGPVSGWLLPRVIVVAVMPGADAALPPLDPDDDDEQAVTAVAAARTTASSADRLRIARYCFTGAP